MSNKSYYTLVAFLSITTLSIMKFANAGNVSITRKGMPQEALLKVLFIAPPNSAKLYRIKSGDEDIYEGLPNGNYGLVNANLQINKNANISKACYADKENFIKVEDNTKINIKIRYEDGKLSCTLTQGK